MRRLAPDGDAAPIRVTAVFPEPTPYRSPLLDRVAALSEIDLTVVYAAETVVRRTWRISSEHRAMHLRGIRMPGADRLVRHDYPITPGVVGALSGVASGRRGRFRLEHVRGAGRDCMVHGFKASRTSSWWRATTKGRGRGGGGR